MNAVNFEHLDPAQMSKMSDTEMDLHGLQE